MFVLPHLPQHLPPTAAPLSLADLRPGLGAPPEATDRFRQALAGYLGVRACFVAASGRTALYLLLRELAGTADHPARREVVMPAYTCPALVRVTLDAGLQPRLVDLSPATLGYEPDLLAAGLGEQTLAVIVVHPFGLPQPLDDVIGLARQVGAVVIEDAAQSLGARWAGRWVGTGGDVGLFSLGPGKPLSTGGGGILCTNDEALIRRLERSCRLPPPALAAVWMPARLALLALLFRPTGWWLATRLGLHRLGDSEAAGGYTLAGLAPTQAALGLALLPRLAALNRRRRENAARLIARLRGLDFVHLPAPAEAAEPVYLRLPILAGSPERRKHLFDRLWAAGIGVGRMYRQSLPQLFPHLALQSYPGAEAVARRLLTLPTHPYLTPDDVERIGQIFDACA